MDRRAFIGTVTGGLLAAPRAAGAQQAGKVSRVGVLVTANPRVYDGFVDELRRLGYVDGQNVVLDFRNAEGQYGRFPALAAELVRAGVDVILPVAAKRRFGQSGRPRRRSPLSSSPLTTTRWR